MRALSLLAFASLVFVAPAANATQVIFEEDFETGSDGWFTGSPWHIEADTDPCGSLVAPFPVGNNAAYYGTATCDFIGFPFSSSIVMENPIHVPTGMLATLTFVGYEEAECSGCGWDYRRVLVYTDASPSPTVVWENGPEQVWHEQDVDLSQFAGQDIRIGFRFAPVDGVDNDYFGWMIDDVRVELTEAPEIYCQTAPNSVGAGATITWEGSTSVADNNFWLRVFDAPSNEFGLFYYGPTALSVPFGDGTRCVGGGATGTVRLNPPGTFSFNGFMERHVDLTAAPAVAGPGLIVAGSEWFFQCWYRDQVGAGHNLSDALRVPFSL